jgi:vacuolar-type H+-ATPase subunit H
LTHFPDVDSIEAPVFAQECADCAAIPGFSMVSAFLTRTIQISEWVAAMASEHGSANENLLEQLATTEHQLEQQVARARDEAQRLVDDARRKADAERQAARREAEELTARARADIARESETVTSQRLAEAHAEAQRVRVQAAERMSAAVTLVVDRVLAGLETR